MLILLAVAGAAYFVLHPRVAYPEAATIGWGAESFADLQGRFTELADEKGASYTFEVLRRASLPPNTDIHFLGHTVGDALYAQKGIDGIVECTQDFRNACSHSIVIGAFVEHGEGAFPLIREACKKAPGGEGAYTMCYHGLGHGVFAYYGYDLPRTIDSCKETATPERGNRDYIECVGGAVMELMGGGGHDKELYEAARQKYLLASRPLNPCMESFMPDDVKEICFVYLTPHLWESVGIDLGVPDPADFPEAFGLCDVVPKSRQELRDACFGGFGKEFVVLSGARDFRRIEDYTDEEYARIAEWCQLAGASDGKEACIAHALASFFWGGENSPEISFHFCSIVPGGSLRTRCLSTLADVIPSYIRNDGTRERLCGRLPVGMRDTCVARHEYPNSIY